ncbi:MAG TPA: hypothetical protein VHY91_21145 [Pirellulales bacterium]|jgi:hypothetical protein|nr:hypothetical protein [Pirellulales bacterium]
MFSRRQFLIGSASALAAGFAGPRRASADEDLAAARADLYRAYAARLEGLAAWCDERHLAGRAAMLRSWLPVRLADRQYLFVPADFRAQQAATQPPPADADGRVARATAEFAERHAALRSEQAAALYRLAERAAERQQGSLACQLASEAAREDLACRRAWRFLDYTLDHDAWQTPFEIQQRKAGNEWHERFGWLPESYAARYQSGERFFQGRWMPAAEEARVRAERHDDWRIETDHYVVTTNCGLEEGVALAGQLERLRAIWQQVFVGYLVDEADLSKRLAAGDPLANQAGPKHNVVYYRTREQYNGQLRALQPQIEMTLGIYLASKRTAYFFAGVDQEPGTIDHEATHQLFHESRQVAKDVGQRDNFWIVEAVACYMQSLARHDGYYTLGGADVGRMPVARQRRLHDGVYLPLAQLVRLGMRDFQGHPDVVRLYTQSAGLAAFLLDRYPEATAAYLRAVYTDRADSDTLGRLTAQDYPQLDHQYREFLAAMGP